jgi:hypothetical protein
MARKKAEKTAPTPGYGSGDKLARGAASATFPSMSHISQMRWNDIFGEDPRLARKKKK